MTRLDYRARANLAALAVVVSLGLGCAGATASKPRAAQPEPVATKPAARPPAPDDLKPAPPSALALTEVEQRHAQALAEYAAGVAAELNTGLSAALPHYEQSLSKDPRNTVLAIRVANIYMGRKDWAKAQAVLEQARQGNPNVSELWFWLGVVAKSGEHNDQAITALQQALKLEPTHLGAIQTLLDIQMAKNADGEVIKLIDQALGQKSKNPGYWVRLGDVIGLVAKQKPSLGRKLDHARVQKCYQQALALAPRDPEILLRLADGYADSGEYKRAAEMYALLFAIQPDIPQLREKLAYNYVRADMKAEAATVFKQIIEREPLRYQLYNALAELYEDLQKDNEAVALYQQSLVIKPDQLEPALRLALQQAKAKQFTEALKTLDTAKSNFPGIYQVPYFYGLVYSDQKEYTKSANAFAEAESLARAATPPIKLEATFYFYFGAAWERAGDLDKAAVLLRKSIDLDPDRAGGYNYLGYMWADKGIHLDEALDLIKKAVAKEPNNGAYLDSLGWVQFKLGHYAEALTQLRRAAELIKDDAVVFDHLADVLLKLGKRDEALTQLRRAKEMDPTNKEIAEKLDKLTAK